MVGTAGVGEGAVGLTMLRVVVTVVVCPVAHTELVAAPVTQAAVTAVAAVLRGWVTVVVVVAAAAVVVVGVTTEGAGGTVFRTELTLLPDWLDITILD